MRGHERLTKLEGLASNVKMEIWLLNGLITTHNPTGRRLLDSQISQSNDLDINISSPIGGRKEGDEYSAHQGRGEDNSLHGGRVQLIAVC